MDDGFSTLQIEDINGEKRNALVHYRKDQRHISISVLDYESGTAMHGQAASLVYNYFTRCKKADLFLAGYGPIRLPLRYPAV